MARRDATIREGLVSCFDFGDDLLGKCSVFLHCYHWHVVIPFDSRTSLPNESSGNVTPISEIAICLSEIPVIVPMNPTKLFVG